ncbi:MAG: hypothetical protein ABJQ70_02610 [Roseobacter sp.]
MRFKKGTSEEAQRRFLDRLAEDLSYMSDAGLLAVRAWVAVHGEGTARCFWPAHVSIVGVAESYEPRPLEELPALVRWFKSKAGESALSEGRLVAEYEFWRKFKRPPVSSQDRGRVQERASEWSGKSARIEERIQRGLSPLHDDGAWLAWYRKTEKAALALVCMNDDCCQVQA